MAEAESRSQEEKLRFLTAAVDAALDGVALVDLSLRFAYVNQAFCRLVECTRAEEMIGRPVTDFAAEDDLRLAASYSEKKLREGRPEAFEMKVRARGGRIVPVEATVSPLRGESGGPRGFLVIVRDISERKQAETQILFKNALLETQMEASIDGILVVDSAGKMISFNGRFVEMWGIPEEVVASRSDERALQSVMDKLADPEAFLARVRHLYEHREEKSTDEIALRDGRTFDRYSAPVIGPDGIYYGRVWYFRDITERKQAEKALEATNRELESFVYTASHDLQTPLASIEGFAQLLAEDYSDRLDAEGRDYLWRVRDSVAAMKALLTDLLELSRVERTEEPKEDVEVGEVVAEALENLAGTISGAGAQIVVAESLPRVRASRRRLLQVFSNLVSNAVKFSREGESPRVAIRWERLRRAYRFLVSDNGIGIEDEFKETVFDVFTRLKRKDVPGTGVGLAIVKRIVEDHGGQVGVDSKPGQGSTFWFTLPDQQ
jgi:PAS domain S-box-containing protein